MNPENISFVTSGSEKHFVGSLSEKYPKVLNYRTAALLVQGKSYSFRITIFSGSFHKMVA
jgi:hypothetical protein